MSRNADWTDEASIAVTVMDKDGVVLSMNEKAGATFAKWGGRDLVGKSLMPCHAPSSREMIRQMVHSGLSNTYTIEKNGVRKLIHQMPWTAGGEIQGLVELSIELPADMKHFVRDPQP